MGDGGGCHPRDNIALSWLARELDLSYDWFEGIMLARERQTDWLADLVEEHHRRLGFADRKVGIYGRAFKAGTNLTVGSPSTLLANLLEERGSEVELYDPHVDQGPCPFVEAGVYVVATCHDEFAAPDWPYPAGSVVIDPWRIVPRRDGHRGDRTSASARAPSPRRRRRQRQAAAELPASRRAVAVARPGVAVVARPALVPPRQRRPLRRLEHAEVGGADPRAVRASP